MYRSHQYFKCEEYHNLFSQYTNLKRYEKIHFLLEIVNNCEIHTEKPKVERECYICSKNIVSSNMSRHIALG